MKSNETARWRSESRTRPSLPPELSLRRAGRWLLDQALPPLCPLCDSAVSAAGELCAACFGRTNFVSAPQCVRCGVPFSSAEQGVPGGLCPACRERPPLFGRARAALRYDDQARRLVLPLKHADRLELAAVLAPFMARAGAALLSTAEVLVPVPLHRRRLFQRKYNQAAVLALNIGRMARRPVWPDALQRIRRTTALGEKSAEERAREVEGAFRVKPSRRERIAGRRVVLVDDVMTSGATANACAAALLEGGAAAVDVLVAARVPDPRLG